MKKSALIASLLLALPIAAQETKVGDKVGNTTVPSFVNSDGRQSLTLEEFSELMVSLRRIAAAVDRTVAEPARALETA